MKRLAVFVILLICFDVVCGVTQEEVYPYLIPTTAGESFSNWFCDEKEVKNFLCGSWHFNFINSPFGEILPPEMRRATLSENICYTLLKQGIYKPDPDNLEDEYELDDFDVSCNERERVFDSANDFVRRERRCEIVSGKKDLRGFRSEVFPDGKMQLQIEYVYFGSFKDVEGEDCEEDDTSCLELEEKDLAIVMTYDEIKNGKAEKKIMILEEKIVKSGSKLRELIIGSSCLLSDSDEKLVDLENENCNSEVNSEVIFKNFGLKIKLVDKRNGEKSEIEGTIKIATPSSYGTFSSISSSTSSYNFRGDVDWLSS